jgi:hypothetical protein
MVLRSSILVLAGLLGGCAQTITGQGGLPLASTGFQPGPGLGGAEQATGSTSAPAGHEKIVEIPHCPKSLARLALVDDARNNLEAQKLTSPLPVLRLMIQQSGCFQIVDRGQAFDAITREQQLAGTTKKSKLLPAEYFLTPQILFQDTNTNSVGSTVGSLFSAAGMPTALAGLGSNMTINTTEAQSVLYLTNAQTGVQLAAATGSAKTSEVGMTASYKGGAFGAAGASLGAYSSSDAGKTAAAALVDAYATLVKQLQKG